MGSVTYNSLIVSARAFWHEHQLGRHASTYRDAGRKATLIRSSKQVQHTAGVACMHCSMVHTCSPASQLVCHLSTRLVLVYICSQLPRDATAPHRWRQRVCLCLCSCKAVSKRIPSDLMD